MRYIEIEIKYFDIDKKCAISYNRVIMLAFPKKDGGKKWKSVTTNYGN